jgi:hypothetical protein
MRSSIIEHLNIIEYIGPCIIARWIHVVANAFFFNVLKKVSATALSYQFPRRLMLGVNRLSLQNLSQSSLLNCDL